MTFKDDILAEEIDKGSYGFLIRLKEPSEKELKGSYKGIPTKIIIQAISQPLHETEYSIEAKAIVSFAYNIKEGSKSKKETDVLISKKPNGFFGSTILDIPKNKIVSLSCSFNGSVNRLDGKLFSEIKKCSSRIIIVDTSNETIKRVKTKERTTEEANTKLDQKISKKQAVVPPAITTQKA